MPLKSLLQESCKLFMVAVGELNCFSDHFIALYWWSLNRKQLFSLGPSILELQLRGRPQVILSTFTRNQSLQCIWWEALRQGQRLGLLAVSCIPGPSSLL